MLITQMDVLRRLFGTVELTLDQWALALVPAVLLLFLWETRQADRPAHGRSIAGSGASVDSRGMTTTAG